MGKAETIQQPDDLLISNDCPLFSGEYRVSYGLGVVRTLVLEAETGVMMGFFGIFQFTKAVMH
jgi:hypothetical protein